MCEYLEGKKSFEEVFEEFNDWTAQEIRNELEREMRGILNETKEESAN